MKKTTLCLQLVLGCFACRGEQRHSTATIQVWHLSATPSVSVGVAEGDQPYELSQATSSVRLGDGRLIIANSGSQELRVFDPAGRFLSAIGRKGQGPGEFEGPLQLRSAGADRYTVYDLNQQKLALFDAAGHLLGEQRVLADGLRDFPLSTWLYRANWVDGPVDTLRRGEIASALDQLPGLAPGTYRFVKVADDGRLWMQDRPATDTNLSWQVLTPSGGLLASIEIPEGLEIHQIGPDFMVVRHWGENDVEQIQLFQVEPSDTTLPLPPSARRQPSEIRAPSLQTQSDLAREVRNLVIVQEMHYADHSRYATRAVELQHWQSPEGMQVHLMAADRRGWVGLLASQIAPQICGMAVGGSTPPGWTEGSPKCSR